MVGWSGTGRQNLHVHSSGTGRQIGVTDGLVVDMNLEEGRF